MSLDPTLANYEENHGFISKEHYLYWYETFWETESKTMRLYA